MLLPLLITYSALFAFLAFKNFRLALGLFIIALPSYLIRFKIGPLPTTLLELNFAILFFVWLVKYAKTDWMRIRQIISQFPYFCISVFLFFLTSIVGIFVSDMWEYSLGQWRAYWLEPMLVFVMVVGRTPSPPFPAAAGSRSLRDKKEGVGGEVSVANARPHPALPLLKGEVTSPRDIILFLTLSIIPISLVAIIQKITGQLYPPSLWNDDLFGRVTSFFTSPNAVGLYLAPIVMLTVGVIASRVRTRRSNPLEFRTASESTGIATSPSARPPTAASLGVLAMTLILSFIALLLTKSLGAWLAVAGGLLIFTYLIGYKKTALGTLIVGIALAISVFPYFSISKSQSLSNRLILWEYSWNYLTASPKNFVFGAGIRQFFRKIQKPHYDTKELERLIYPHNIFLNLWTEIGLIGMLAFVGMFACLARITYHVSRHQDKYLGAGLAAALAAILIHGMIDVPYFKNDLAMMFWIVAAIIINRAQTKNLSAADRS